MNGAVIKPEHMESVRKLLSHIFLRLSSSRAFPTAACIYMESKKGKKLEERPMLYGVCAYMSRGQKLP